MNIPFSVEQFFEVFALYNQSVWPMQIFLNLLALGAVGWLFQHYRWQSRLVSAVLSFFWAWMAIAYHFVFFTAINPAAWLFGVLFLAGAFWFAWTGVVRERLRFHLRSGIWGWIGGILIMFALLIYPWLGYMLGHHYPAVPTFGLPCPTTIFTIGMLLFAAPPVPRSVFVVPLLWSAIGSIAAFQLGVFQDLGLLVAGLIGLAAVPYPRQRSNVGGL